MEVKRCRQCGLLKEVDKFRPYTYSKRAETEGRYSICRSCEAINSRYKRAIDVINDPSINPLESHRKDEARQVCNQIQELYDILRAKGLKVPDFTTKKPVKADDTSDTIARLKAFYVSDSAVTTTSEAAVEPPEDIPDDLKPWLEKDYTGWTEKGLSPEYLQETVYEALRAKYRPQTGIDKEKLLPVYDDTYKATLNEILRNFDEYEEWCIEQQTTQEEG